MDWFAPVYRRDPNAMVYSLYQGVANGNATVTSIVKKDPKQDWLERSSEFGPGLQRGQGGMAGVLVIGGMETTLDEMEYILECRRQKKWEPRKSQGDIVQMCQAVAERRNAQIKYFRKNPSEAPKPLPRRRGLYLPKGYRMMPTSEPGLKVRVKI